MCNRTLIGVGVGVGVGAGAGASFIMKVSSAELLMSMWYDYQEIVIDRVCGEVKGDQEKG